MIKATYFEVCYSDYFTAIAKNAVDVILFVNDPILKNRHDGFAYTKQKSLDPFLQMILNGQKFNEEMIPKRVLFAVHRTDMFTMIKEDLYGMLEFLLRKETGNPSKFLSS